MCKVVLYYFAPSGLCYSSLSFCTTGYHPWLSLLRPFGAATRTINCINQDPFKSVLSVQIRVPKIHVYKSVNLWPSFVAVFSCSISNTSSQAGRPATATGIYCPYTFRINSFTIRDIFSGCSVAGMWPQNGMPLMVA